MRSTIVRFIFCFAASIAAAVIACLLVDGPHRAAAAVGAYVLTAGGMYWLLDLDSENAS